ncbi:MAG: RNA polymerase sigma factor [Bacteroidota bacterium]
MHIDLDLLQNCVNNDRRAQKKLYELCYRIFMPLCMRYNKNEEDARFAFNNSYMKILAGLENVNLKEIIFFPWAKRIVTNVLIDEYRKQKLHQAHFINKETDRELELHSANSDNEAESNFGYAALLKMISEIPEMHALVFKLYVMEDMSHKEIAEHLHISEGTSKWHLSIARKMLREKLEKIDALTDKKMVI